MAECGENIFPIYDKLLTRANKELFLKQKARVLWFTGLSGSGKSTIANGVENELHHLGYFTMLLDGDNVRSGINANLGFSEEDRKENIRRIAEIAKLFVHCGVITICCFVSPTEEVREMAREIIGKDDFVEIYVNTSIAVCEKRDVKGLYAKARRGEIKDFTGVSAPFEEPVKADIVVKTDELTVYESVQCVLAHVLPKVQQVLNEKKDDFFVI